jgi:hypothetical protein
MEDTGNRAGNRGRDYKRKRNNNARRGHWEDTGDRGKDSRGKSKGNNTS